MKKKSIVPNPLLAPFINTTYLEKGKYCFENAFAFRIYLLAQLKWFFNNYSL